MLEAPQREKIFKGLKFTSTHFSNNGEVVAVRKDQNQIDVMLISSEGHGRIEENWNYAHFSIGLDNGSYTLTKPEVQTSGVW